MKTKQIILFSILVIYIVSLLCWLAKLLEPTQLYSRSNKSSIKPLSMEEIIFLDLIQLDSKIHSFQLPPFISLATNLYLQKVDTFDICCSPVDNPKKLFKFHQEYLKHGNHSSLCSDAKEKQIECIFQIKLQNNTQISTNFLSFCNFNHTTGQKERIILNDFSLRLFGQSRPQASYFIITPTNDLRNFKDKKNSWGQMYNDFIQKKILKKYNVDEIHNKKGYLLEGKTEPNKDEPEHLNLLFIDESLSDLIQFDLLKILIKAPLKPLVKGYLFFHSLKESMVHVFLWCNHAIGPELEQTNNEVPNNFIVGNLTKLVATQLIQLVDKHYFINDAFQNKHQNLFVSNKMFLYTFFQEKERQNKKIYIIYLKNLYIIKEQERLVRTFYFYVPPSIQQSTCLKFWAQDCCYCQKNISNNKKMVMENIFSKFKWNKTQVSITFWANLAQHSNFPPQANNEILPITVLIDWAQSGFHNLIQGNHKGTEGKLCKQVIHRGTDTTILGYFCSKYKQNFCIIVEIIMAKLKNDFKNSFAAQMIKILTHVHARMKFLLQHFSNNQKNHNNFFLAIIQYTVYRQSNKLYDYEAIGAGLSLKSFEIEEHLFIIFNDVPIACINDNQIKEIFELFFKEKCKCGSIAYKKRNGLKSNVIYQLGTKKSNLTRFASLWQLKTIMHLLTNECKSITNYNNSKKNIKFQIIENIEIFEFIQSSRTTQNQIFYFIQFLSTKTAASQKDKKFHLNSNCLASYFQLDILTLSNLTVNALLKYCFFANLYLIQKHLCIAGFNKELKIIQKEIEYLIFLNNSDSMKIYADKIFKLIGKKFELCIQIEYDLNSKTWSYFIIHKIQLIKYHRIAFGLSILEKCFLWKSCNAVLPAQIYTTIFEAIFIPILKEQKNIICKHKSNEILLRIEDNNLFLKALNFTKSNNLKNLLPALKLLANFKHLLETLRSLNSHIFIINYFIYDSWTWGYFCHSEFDCYSAQVAAYNRRLNLERCYGGFCSFCSSNSDCISLHGCYGQLQCVTLTPDLPGCQKVSYDINFSGNVGGTDCNQCVGSDGTSICPGKTCNSNGLIACAKKCYSNADCPYNAPLCDTSGLCHWCTPTSLAGCNNHGMDSCPIMWGTIGFCYKTCTSDYDCAQIKFKPYCISGKCLNCQSDEWCHINRNMKVCNFSQGFCMNSCNFDTDCMNPAKSKCSTDGFCVGCTTDAQCSHILSYKFCINLVCKQCTTDNQCPSFNPIALYCVFNFCKTINTCLTTKDCTNQNASKCNGTTCIGCVSDTDCSHILGSRNKCQSSICVECTSNADCTSPYRALCASGVCSKCTGNGNCSTMINGRNTICNIPLGECSCTSNSGCNNPAASQCFNNSCISCSTNGDCSHMKNLQLICDSGTCRKACTSNSNCVSAFASKCSSGNCNSCNSDDDCLHMKSYLYKCVSGECHECGTNNDCPSRYSPVCRYNHCSFCMTDSDCSKFNSSCVDTVCQECVANSNCLSSLKSRCFMQTCWPCSTNGDCRPHISAGSTCSTGVCSGCISNSNCSFAATSRCSANACVACTTDSECSHITGGTLGLGLKYCVSGECKECTSNSHCNSDNKALCSANICADCATNGDCLIRPTNKFCASGNCVICLTNSTCLLATASRCSTNICVACITDSECSHITGGTLGLGLKYCASGACKECTSNSHCNSDDKSLCSANICADCGTNLDCSARLNQICLAGNCICLTNSDCRIATASRCNGNTCVACTTDSECSHITGGTLGLGLKYCVSGECKECTSNSHCNNDDKSLCSANICADCTTNGDCLIRPTNKFCASGNCLICLTNSSCLSAIASRCNANICVACTADGECSHITGGVLGLGLHYCASGECKECTSNSHCNSDDKSLCSGNICADCITNGDCLIRPTNKFCASGNCVICLTNSDCTIATTSNCNGNTCVSCLIDAECSHIPGGALAFGLKYCVSGECKECTTNDNCNSDNKSLCNTNICVDCITNNDCSTRPVNKLCASGDCVLCLTNTDCTSGTTSRCNGNACVACTTDSECSHIAGGVLGLGLKYCVYGVCNECTTNNHCNSDDKSLCSLNLCTDCITNGDCLTRPINKICSLGNCVTCLINSDCTLTTASKCDSMACVACTINNECSHIIGLSFCLSGECVECASNSNCNYDNKSYCGSFHTCSSCQTDAHCLLRSSKLICLLGNCVECIFDSHCASLTGSVCLANSCTGCSSHGDCSQTPSLSKCVSATCVECISNADCNDDNKSLCNYLYKCVPCEIDNDCSFRGLKSICSFGSCAECLTDSHCSSPMTSKCISNTCTACSSDSECLHLPSLQKCTYGTCVECITNINCITPSFSKCSSNSCIPCTTDIDCVHMSSGFIKCVSNSCTSGCTSNIDCDSDDKSICINNLCADCVSDEDCVLRTPNSICYIGDCVECAFDSNCDSDFKPICNFSLKTCAPCLYNSDCLSRNLKTICAIGLNSSSNMCVECRNNSDCPNANSSRCDYSYSCSQCQINEDCSHITNGEPLCTNGLCIISCYSSGDCTTDAMSKCDINQNYCVACMSDDDCSLRAPKIFCSTLGCVGCKNNNDCMTPSSSRCTSVGCFVCLSDNDCRQFRSLYEKCESTGCQHCSTCLKENVCKSNNECQKIDASLCNDAGACVGCDANEDCNHLDGTIFCDNLYKICVECVDNDNCNDSSKVCINHICTLISTEVNNILEQNFNVTSIDQLGSILSNITNLTGFDLFDLSARIDEHNITDTNQIDDFVANLFDNSTFIAFHDTSQLLNKFSASNFNELEAAIASNYNIKNSSLSLSKNISDVNNYYQEVKNTISADNYLEISKQTISMIESSLIKGSQEKTTYTHEEINDISQILKEFANSSVAFQNTVNKSKSIELSQNHALIVVDLLSKVDCELGHFPESALYNLLETTDSVFENLNYYNTNFSEFSVGVDHVINSIENKYIDIININSTRYNNDSIKMNYNGNVYNLSMEYMKLNQLFLKEVKSTSGNIKISINTNNILQFEADSNPITFDRPIICSIKEWVDVLAAAGENASFAATISNASALSVPVSVTLKDAQSKLELINKNFSIGVINITVPLQNISDHNKKVGGLFYSRETQEWRSEGILSTIISEDNKTATIVTSHLTDFQVFSYVESQLINLKKQSNFDMLKDISILSPANTDLYSSPPFIIMCTLTGATVLCSIGLVIYDAINKQQLLKRQNSNRKTSENNMNRSSNNKKSRQMIKVHPFSKTKKNKNSDKIIKVAHNKKMLSLSQLAIFWLKSLLVKFIIYLTHKAISPFGIYDPKVSRTARFLIYTIQISTIYMMGALFFQEDPLSPSYKPYTVFQQAVIILLSSFVNALQSFILTTLMMNSSSKRKNRQAEKNKFSISAKQIFGYFIIGSLYLGYGYSSLAILAHFSNNVRSQWTTNFCLSFLVDNIMTHLCKVGVTGVILTLISLQKLSEKLKNFALKILDINMITIFKLNLSTGTSK